MASINKIIKEYLFIKKLIKSMNVGLYSISFAEINTMKAEDLITKTNDFLELEKFLEKKDYIINSLRSSPTLLSYKVYGYRISLNRLRHLIHTILSLRILIETCICHKEVLYSVTKFINEILNFLASAYGHEPLSNKRIVLLMTSLDPTVEYLDTTLEEMVLLFCPFTICSDISESVLLVHEIGHIYIRYYLIGKGAWNSIVNNIIKFLKDKNKENLKDRYKKWLREFFADNFSLSILGPIYLKKFLSSYFSLITSKEQAEEDIEHPPILVRLKLLILTCEKLGFKVDSGLKHLIDNLLCEHSGDILTGSLSVDDLLELLNMLYELFQRIILENMYKELPYDIVKHKSEGAYPLLSSIIESASR